MKKIYLSELPIEALTKRKNLLKGVVIGLGSVWLVLIAFALYFFIYKATGKLFLSLAAFPTTMLPLVLQMRALDKELKSRQLKAQEPNEL